MNNWWEDSLDCSLSCENINWKQWWCKNGDHCDKTKNDSTKNPQQATRHFYRSSRIVLSLMGFITWDTDGVTARIPFWAALKARLWGCQCRSVHRFAPDWNISTTRGRIAMKFCADIHGPQRMNSTDFGDPLTFPCHEIWYTSSCPPQDEL